MEHFEDDLKGIVAFGDCSLKILDQIALVYRQYCKLRGCLASQGFPSLTMLRAVRDAGVPTHTFTLPKIIELLYAKCGEHCM